MRPKFKTSRICSSENYKSSKNAHIAMLKRNHSNNEEYFKSVKPVMGEIIYTERTVYDDDFITFLLNMN